MHILEYTFSQKKIRYFLNAPFAQVEQLVAKEKCIIITDENVYLHHADKFSSYKIIILPAGEQHKNQSTIDFIINKLICMEADRTFFVIGVGGGVVTDLAGFAAAVYMRGIRFAFVPTTLLAQVDAAIGGKNGIDVGVYKNLVGVIRQPEFILFDHAFLQSLPNDQWVNGMAEVIKHGCIKDENLFHTLEQHTLKNFQHDPDLLAAVIERNVVIKSGIVESDEFESGERKLLNFGHTVGHAIENVYQLPHGHAVSFGMAVACTLSCELNNFPVADKERVFKLIKRYHLPTSFNTNKNKVFGILKMDKKRSGDNISFILLNKIGEAVIHSINLSQLEALLLKN